MPFPLITIGIPCVYVVTSCFMTAVFLRQYRKQRLEVTRYKFILYGVVVFVTWPVVVVIGTASYFKRKVMGNRPSNRTIQIIRSSGRSREPESNNGTPNVEGIPRPLPIYENTNEVENNIVVSLNDDPIEMDDDSSSNVDDDGGIQVTTTSIDRGPSVRPYPSNLLSSRNSDEADIPRYGKIIGLISVMKANEYNLDDTSLCPICLASLQLDSQLEIDRKIKEVLSEQVSQKADDDTQTESSRNSDGESNSTDDSDEYENGPEVEKEDVCVTPCYHYFHFQCIAQWLLQNKKSCPECRTPASLRQCFVLVPDLSQSTTSEQPMDLTESSSTCSTVSTASKLSESSDCTSKNYVLRAVYTKYESRQSEAAIALASGLGLTSLPDVLTRFLDEYHVLTEDSSLVLIRRDAVSSNMRIESILRNWREDSNSATLSALVDDADPQEN